MARKRSHKNTTRLTAKERAHALCSSFQVQASTAGNVYASATMCKWVKGGTVAHSEVCVEAQRAIQAAVRQALARKERRAK